MFCYDLPPEIGAEVRACAYMCVCAYVCARVCAAYDVWCFVGARAKATIAAPRVTPLSAVRAPSIIRDAIRTPHQWSRFLNDDLAATCAARSDRMIGLGTVPLQDSDAAVAELRRCVLELGLRGVQIGSHINAHVAPGVGGAPATTRNLPLCAPELRPFWREAAKLGAAVLVHPWDMEWWCPSAYWQPWLIGMPSETALAGSALILGGVLDELPDLKVMLSHGGGSLPYLIGRVEWGHKCRPDLVAVDSPGSPRGPLSRLYVDSICHDEKVCRSS